MSPVSIDPFINEFHYRDANTTNEFVEIGGLAGTDLTGFEVIVYDGKKGTRRRSKTLSGTLNNQIDGFGFMSVQVKLDNNNDGIALVTDTGLVLEFLSYKGEFTASNGPADRMESIDIGVHESSSVLSNFSLQRVGDGCEGSSFTWASPQENTRDLPNAGQSFDCSIYRVTTPTPSRSILPSPSETSSISPTISESASPSLSSTPSSSASISPSASVSFGSSQTPSPSLSASVSASPVTIYPFINEFHYHDENGTTEFVEIAGLAGMDLTGFQVITYDGKKGTTRRTRELTGILTNQIDGFGFMSVEVKLDNALDGITLVSDTGEVLEFISYEGQFTATDGPADRMVSIDVGVQETSNTAANFSLQRVGVGCEGASFSWSEAQLNTRDEPNTGQSFDCSIYRVTTPTPSRSILPSPSETPSISPTISESASASLSATPSSSSSISPSASVSLGSSQTPSPSLSMSPSISPVIIDPFINEFHYQDSNTTNEFVEIAGLAGTDLTGFQVIVYDGNRGILKRTRTMTGSLTDQIDGFGFMSVQVRLDNNKDGIVLVSSTGEVLEFLSYEGQFTASDGPADRMESIDVGVEESSSAQSDFSLQRVGAGCEGSSFTWVAPQANTRDLPNTGQSFDCSMYRVTTPTPSRSILPTATPSASASASASATSD